MGEWLSAHWVHAPSLVLHAARFASFLVQEVIGLKYAQDGCEHSVQNICRYMSIQNIFSMMDVYQSNLYL